MNRIVSDKYPQMLVGRLSKYDVKNQNTKVDQMGAVSVNAYESRTIRDKRYAIVIYILIYHLSSLLIISTESHVPGHQLT